MTMVHMLKKFDEGLSIIKNFLLSFLMVTLGLEEDCSSLESNWKTEERERPFMIWTGLFIV